MFNSAYFRTGLPVQLEAAGAEPTVELHLANGQAHRVRALIEAADGYAVLEVYQRRAEISGAKANWHGTVATGDEAGEVHRAIVAYESMTQIVITATQAASSPRIGFGAR